MHYNLCSVKYKKLVFQFYIKLFMLNENDRRFDFSTQLQKQEIKRKERDTKHYAPANKEWKNSVYFYNKNYLLNTSVKDKTAANAIKGYFNLLRKPNHITKSKRMRDMLRHKSTNQFFVSRPEIKQTNDKINITVYTYNRQKALYLKKLFFLNRWLSVNTITPNWQNDRFQSNKFLINKYEIPYLISKKVFKKRQISFNKSRNIGKNCLLKYNMRKDFLLNNVTLLLKKKEFISNLLIFHFLTWILLMLNVKVCIDYDYNTIIITFKLNRKNKIIEKKIKTTFNIDSLKLINLLLKDHIKIINNKPIKKNIFTLFNLFKNRYFKIIARKYMKKEILIVKYLNKLYLNEFKFHTYIPGLKTVLNGIYNKKVQLNIVNLKYLHLNSDLFTEAIAIKLKDRTKSLLGILIKSFGIVKTFKSNNMFLLSEKEKNDAKGDIYTYFGKYNVINGNILNAVFKKMFKKHEETLNSNLNTIVTSLRYKWITGIRVEAAGRLTKRYAAARALFKYKYRGSLKNLEHLKNVENKLESPSLHLLRGEMRPNLQHSFLASKRRIGAFGIKSWISSS